MSSVTFTPDPASLALAARFGVGLRSTQRGGLPGERLGRAAGSSLEFEDRREYLAGDDLRHVDWRAFARTDQLLVRQYREEISPRLEVVLDASASMAAVPAKAQAALDVAALLVESARADGLQVRLDVLGERAEQLPLDGLMAAGVEFAGAVPLDELLREREARASGRALVVCISDFLCERGVAPLVRRLGGRALRLGLVQVLSEQELEPALDGALRLTDVETGAVRDLVLDAKVLAEYRGRLERLLEELAGAARAQGAAHALLRAEAGLESGLAEGLVPAGIFAPRGA